MKYIDWYYEKTEKGIKILADREDGYRVWKDLVTGTCYCISGEDYKRIDSKGRGMLEQFLKEGSLDKMEQLFYGCGGKKDEDLFPDLPYFTNSEGDIEACARIRDYVCFRTACLYALKYSYIVKDSSVENQKDQIRLLGFTWGFAESAPECRELEQIEQMLCAKDRKECGSVTDMADLVKGGLVKIKQYYLETNKIPEIRGASLLLEKVNTEKTKQLISREHIRECLIYAGGGKMMGIFPEGTGEKIRRKIEAMVEEETVTALFNYCSRPYKLSRLVCDYKNVNDEMNLALEERQGLRWDFRLEPQAGRGFLNEVFMHEGWEEIKEEKKTKVFCTSCRNRYAAAVLSHGEEKENLCPSCIRKRMEGGRDAKRSRHMEYKGFVEQNYHKILNDGKEYNKLGDIAEDRFIGIIYGDANSMSRHVNSLQSFMAMRYFSEVSAGIIRDVVFRALHKNLGDRLCFEVIAVGGDDIFLIVPGNRAYDIACTIGKKFDCRFQNKSNGEHQMTMSLGVCITHDNMPVQYSFSIAKELLESAKKKAWEEQEAGDSKGTMDWLVIENEMPGGRYLKYLRKDTQDKPEKTLRPYTWKQAEGIKKFIVKIKDEKPFAFQLSQSLYKHTKEESKLFYEYQLSRKEESESYNGNQVKKEKSKIPSGLKQLAKEFGGKADSHYIVCRDNVYSPWLDIIELWDYVGDMK